jgi:uncharacterized protein with NRDE domain
MCLIIFAYQSDPRFPLVVAANRDEIFVRPTDQSTLWTDGESGQQILSGRDKQAGGTWLGITQSGRFAAVTNIRDPYQTEHRTRSRGNLTREYLTGNDSPQQYCKRLTESYDQFAGYNLLVGDNNSLFYVNNHEEKVWEVEPGVHGLSNGFLNSSWPKVDKGKTRLQVLMQQPERLTTDALLAMMSDRSQAQDADLPDTGVGIEIERKLSSAFILNPTREYGTLCSTALIVDQRGATRFSEQNFDSLGNRSQGHTFQLPPA